MTSPVGSRCCLFRFDKSSLFSLPVSKANTTHCSKMESPQQQLEKIRSQKVFLKKVSFFQGEVSSLSKLGQSRIRSSSRCSGPPCQANSSFLHPWWIHLPRFRERFEFPTLGSLPCQTEGPPNSPVIYMCGNSLGLKPKQADEYMREQLGANLTPDDDQPSLAAQTAGARELSSCISPAGSRQRWR